MAKEIMLAENLKAWLEEVKELYDVVVPPKMQAFLSSAVNTFISAFASSIVILLSADQINPEIFKDGTWTMLLISTAYSAGAVTLREIIKRIRNEYDYEELKEKQVKWEKAISEAKKEIK